MRAIMNVRDIVQVHQGIWDNMELKKKFKCTGFYQVLIAGPSPPWFRLCLYNLARPSTMVIMWLLFHKSISTKSRMVVRLGFITDDKCNFCDQEETYNHIFFDSIETKKIWKDVLEWIQIKHSPIQWDTDLP